MNTCFSSLRLLSSRMDRYRLVHSSAVVMIMLPRGRRYCRCPCRRRWCRSLLLRPGGCAAIHRVEPAVKRRLAPSWTAEAPGVRGLQQLAAVEP